MVSCCKLIVYMKLKKEKDSVFSLGFIMLMQIPPDVVCAVDELRKTTQACFSTSSKSLQHQILDQAFAR